MLTVTIFFPLQVLEKKSAHTAIGLSVAMLLFVVQ